MNTNQKKRTLNKISRVESKTLSTSLETLNPKVGRIEEISSHPQSGQKDYSHGLIWNGFEYEWHDHPHRLSVLASRFIDKKFTQAGFDAQHQFEARIGSFPPDYADYETKYRHFRTGKFFVGYGSRSGIVLQGLIDNGLQVTTQIKINVGDLETGYQGSEWTNFEEVKVLLNGFKVKASEDYGFSSGWHFGGLGIRITNAKVKHGELSFDLWTHVRPSRSPDPATRGLFGKWKKDDPCKYEFTVDYAVLCGGSRHLHFTDKTFECSATKEKDFVYRLRIPENAKDPGGGLERGMEILRTVSGKPGYPKAIPGLFGFHFRISDAGFATRVDGRYIRSLGARVQTFSYDADSGKGEIGPLLHFSNKSGLTSAFTSVQWNLSARLDTTLVQFRGVRDVDYERIQDVTSKGSGPLIDVREIHV